MSELVSIIIVNWNGKQWLGDCLSSIFKQDYKNFEIVVVDNRSTDGSIEYLRENFPQVKVVQNHENLGFAEGNNIGVRHTQGSLVLLLNNDTVVTQDFLSKLVEKMLSALSIGACQPKIRLLDQPDRLDSVGSFPTRTGFFRHYGLNEIDSSQYDHLEEIFSPKGACLLIRKDVFEKINGFDSDFFCYFEETDLAWRIWLAGYRVVLVPQAIIYHKMGATSQKLNFDFVQFHSNKNRINSYIKNLGALNLLCLLPIHLFFYGLIILGAAFTLRFGRVSALLKALTWNVLNLRTTLRKRSYVQDHIRSVSDKEIFKGKITSVPWKAYFNSFSWFLFTKPSVSPDRTDQK
jgi:GT2 family glycosyltransferase